MSEQEKGATTSTSIKQAKKRLRNPIVEKGVLIEEDPFSPNTKYNLGSNSQGKSAFKLYLRRNKGTLSILGFFAAVIIIYFVVFTLDDGSDDIVRVPDSKVKIQFNLHPEERKKSDIDDKHDVVQVKPPLEQLKTIDDYYKNFANDVDSKNKARRSRVRDAMQHAYGNYVKLVWGKDELKPLSGSFHNWVTDGIGMTTLDSLDTLYIMGLKDEFTKAVQFVTKEMASFSSLDNSISLFETTIRVLGGLISAYDLSGEKVFLDRAKDMGDLLLPAFSTSTGVPYSQINLKTGRASNFAWNAGCSVLSEFGTLQLEFRRLTELTGDAKYDNAALKVMDVMEKHSKRLSNPGLYPVNFNPDQDSFCNDHITLGAYGDSYYEYLLKQWIMSNGRLERFRVLYEESARGIAEHLLVKPSNHWYISEMRGGQKVNKVDHLVCFASGMYALGHATNATGSDLNALEIAKQFGKTCYDSYITTKSGLGPEVYQVNDNGIIIPTVRTYLLRPETVESIFILYRVTGDDMYREWGWKIFEAIEKNCRVENGYSGVQDVTADQMIHDDFQQSFFLAETLKYLYLLFSPTNVIPLDKWVFNTEAHPFKIST